MTTAMIQTSCYGRLKQIVAAGLKPVAISVGVPPWYKGDTLPALAPTRAMLKMPPAQYDPLYAAILAKLNPQQIALQLGKGAVILCWEKPVVEKCHRRLVAEWLERHLSIVVPEFGYDRKDCPPYAETGVKGQAEPAPARTAAPPAATAAPQTKRKSVPARPGQPTLF